MKCPGYVRNLYAATDKRICADIVGQAAGDDDVSSFDFARLCARYAQLWPDTSENREEGGLTP